MNIKNKTKAKGIHKGANIHHQLQVITPQSFNTRKIKNKMQKNPLLQPIFKSIINLFEQLILIF